MQNNFFSIYSQIGNFFKPGFVHTCHIIIGIRLRELG